MLVTELLALTLAFDTQNLLLLDSPWARVVGWTPELLRLATTGVLVTVTLIAARNVSLVRELPWGDRHPGRWKAFGCHLLALAVFSRISAVVLPGEPPFVARPGLWTLGWLLFGLFTIVSWGLTLFPVQTWTSLASRTRQSMAAGIVAGTALWATGFLTQVLWDSLARWTFTIVEWTLGLFYGSTVSDPQLLKVGTSEFKVIITAACSGYEGMGLVVAFLSIYLWFFRKELRFPNALILLPLGALTAWLVNVLRIVALVAIGTAGWREVAMGGFHSQAGWIAFNVIALGFVAVTMRFQLFSSTPRTRNATRPRDDATTPYLAPFLAVSVMAMLTGAMSAGFDWFYPVRLLAVGAVLWTFRAVYARLNWTWSWWAAGIGCATFVIWLALVPASSGTNHTWPQTLQAMPWYWAAVWLACRTLGYVLVAPLAEELAFRGFLTRRLVQADFDKLPVGAFTWPSFVISSVVFGLLHGGLWLPGTLAGMLFAIAMYRRGALGHAVQAHAVTNGLIALYVFATGRWSVWA